MKQFLALAALAVLTACNSGSSTPPDAKITADSPAAAMKDIQSPYPIMYSSKFVMDDPKNAETLLTLWKQFDNGNLAAGKDLFGDTVELNFADGSKIRASRDSVIAAGQAYRNSMASVSSEVHAIMAIKSTDKNEHWALIWGVEKDTQKNGKVDSSNLHEAWKFQDGKAVEVLQYRAAFAAPKMKK